jgi:hypothetical protein
MALQENAAEVKVKVQIIIITEKVQVAFLPQKYLQAALLIAKENVEDASEVKVPIIPIAEKVQVALFFQRSLEVTPIIAQEDAAEVKVQIILIIKEAQATIPVEIKVQIE